MGWEVLGTKVFSIAEILSWVLRRYGILRWIFFVIWDFQAWLESRYTLVLDLLFFFFFERALKGWKT